MLFDFHQAVINRRQQLQQEVVEEISEHEEEVIEQIALTGEFRLEIESKYVKFFTSEVLKSLLPKPFVCTLDDTKLVLTVLTDASSLAPNFTKQHPNWTEDEKLCAFFSERCTSRVTGSYGKLSVYKGKLPVRMDDYQNLQDHFIPWHQSHPHMFPGGVVSFDKGNNFDVHLWYWYQDYPNADRSLKLW